LFRLLQERARAAGIRRFTVETLADNLAARAPPSGRRRATLLERRGDGYIGFSSCLRGQPSGPNPAAEEGIDEQKGPSMESMTVSAAQGRGRWSHL
jgi:hypothetical protein